ncbi:hypothetical protein BABINDRAFT_162855 [Babjeviella inositovora NRRL Y-12698]|uniref:Uncharacterized protein n=1 Tax=Babjeviella inositovora NRRL Y-12698 TaxID=984486 RepID=A0A1E3QL42_9ASCO|nr:uncharacterized protein BABINDRAFT_162855 [Babjeviella inositovora NRRL Y-12698]ODQ78184.1 hypothetical protein BABINDRAFT_162855 [Babjeviella inositovora NRRL Y-12698]
MDQVATIIHKCGTDIYQDCQHFTAEAMRLSANYRPGKENLQDIWFKICFQSHRSNLIY